MTLPHLSLRAVKIAKAQALSNEFKTLVRSKGRGPLQCDWTDTFFLQVYYYDFTFFKV